MIPESWNTLKANNRRRVFGKWHCYRDGAHWRTIAPEFRSDGSRFVSDYLPARFSVPALATQTASVEVTNEFDIFARASITDSAFVLDITPEGVAAVDGHIDEGNPTQVIYSGAYRVGGLPVGDLIYGVWHGRAPRLEKVVRINTLAGITSEVVEYSWLIQHTDARAYVGGNRWDGSTADVAAPVTVRRGDSLIRGAGLKAPVAWYYDATGNLIVTPIATRWEYVDQNTMRLTKIVPRTLIATALVARPGGWLKLDATATIYPDPDAEVSSVDGYAQRVAATGSAWAAMRDGTGTASNDSSTTMAAPLMQSYTNSLNRIMARGIYSFDTSSLSGLTVSDASLYLTAWADAHHDWAAVGDVSLTGGTTASTTAIGNSDFQGFAGIAFTDVPQALENWTSGTTHAIAMNAAGIAAIDTEGQTTLFTRFTDDITDVEPTQPGALLTTALIIHTAEATGTANDPYLEITTAEAAPAADHCNKRRQRLRMTHSCDSKG